MIRTLLKLPFSSGLIQDRNFCFKDNYVSSGTPYGSAYLVPSAIMCQYQCQLTLGNCANQAFISVVCSYFWMYSSYKVAHP